MPSDRATGPYLECRDQVGRLEQRQLADLVDNGGNLGVGGRGGIARLPPPLYPLLCASGGGAGVDGGAGSADAAPQGARCGGGHCGLRVVVVGAERRWMESSRQCSRLGFRCAERRRRCIGSSAEHVWVRAKKDVRELRRRRRDYIFRTYSSVEIMGRRPSSGIQLTTCTHGR
jgi:hypothetical protein